jgi:hypothetical protein
MPSGVCYLSVHSIRVLFMIIELTEETGLTMRLGPIDSYTAGAITISRFPTIVCNSGL